MAAKKTTLVEDMPTETEKVVAWRFTELIRAGYSDEDAALLSESFYVDLHFAVDLITKLNCPPDQATLILA